MNATSRILSAAFLFFVSLGAAAQDCVPAPYIMGQQQRCWDGRPLSSIPYFVGQRPRIPTNCQLVRKSFWDRVSGGAQTAFINGIVGGLTGAAIDRAGRTGGQWTHVGLNAGAAIGFAQGSSDDLTMICQGQQGIAQSQEGTRQSRVHSQTVTVPSDCDITGDPTLQDLPGLTKEKCAAIAASLTTKGGGQKDYGTTPTMVGGHMCSVLTPDGRVLADFLDAAKNPKGIVVTSGPQCVEEKRAFSKN